ncbi:hypothetical protein OIU76_003777, partial [Salix suchowensis]
MKGEVRGAAGRRMNKKKETVAEEVGWPKKESDGGMLWSLRVQCRW